MLLHNQSLDLAYVYICP